MLFQHQGQRPQLRWSFQHHGERPVEFLREASPYPTLEVSPPTPALLVSLPQAPQWSSGSTFGEEDGFPSIDASQRHDMQIREPKFISFGNGQQVLEMSNLRIDLIPPCLGGSFRGPVHLGWEEDPCSSAASVFAPSLSLSLSL